MDVLTIINLEAVFLLALFFPLLLQLIILYAISRALWVFTGRYFGRFAWTLLALIGVPVHELSHALGFLITGAGMSRIVLFAPRGLPEYGGATGVVVPARQPSMLSRLVAAIAPFFGCSLAAWLILQLLIPTFSNDSQIIAAPLSGIQTSNLWHVVLRTLGAYARSIFAGLWELDWGRWQTYLAIYVGASLGMGAAPSAEDFKRFFPAMLLGLLILIPVFALVQTFSQPDVAFAAAQQFVARIMVPIGTALSYATIFAALVLSGLVLLLPLRRIFR